MFSWVPTLLSIVGRACDSAIALTLCSSFILTTFHFHSYLNLFVISNYTPIQAHLIRICQHDHYLSFPLFLYFSTFSPAFYYFHPYSF